MGLFDGWLEVFGESLIWISAPASSNKESPDDTIPLLITGLLGLAVAGLVVWAL
jgi:hypothetical protein